MTEDEAKTKSCFQTLAPVPGPLRGVVYGPTACIGSACMAWRFELLGTNDRGDAKFSTVSGYCGLVGAPQ